MATTFPWGESVTVLMELGFPTSKFTLGDYSTKITRTNLVKNPSFEVSTTGWTTSSASITRITTDSYAGGACCQVSKLAVANGRIRGVSTTSSDRIPVTAGMTYRFSWWVKVPAGQPSCSLRIRTEEYQASGTRNSDQVSSATVVSDTDGWVRLSFSDTPTTGANPTVTMVTSIEETTTNARTYLVDAAMVEQTSTLLPYFDGSYLDSWSGYILDGALSWSGTANASTSSATFGLIGSEIQDFTEPTDGSLLDSYYLDGTTLGDDVSSYCREVSISRGRSDQLANFSAGTAQFRLLNNDRRFDPINEDSPYWDSTLGRSGVTPRRKVTVLLDNEPVYVGRITDIDVIYDFNLSEVAITTSDDFVLLANTTTGAAFTPPEELSGARVERILDLASVNYPIGTRNIGTGIAALGAYQIGDNTNALTYLQRIADAEQGYLFISKDGYLTFTDRLSASFITSSASFSDDGTEIPYSSLAVLYGQEFLYNRVSAQTEGGTIQNADDATSQTEFGISTLALSDLLLADDADALTLANTLLDRYSQPVYRFDELQVSMNRLTSGQRLDVLALEIGNVIEITRTYATGTPASVTAFYAIEGISHGLNPNQHVVTIRLTPAEIVYAFILDDATYGVLDADNALT